MSSDQKRATLASLPTQLTKGTKALNFGQNPIYQTLLRGCFQVKRRDRTEI